MCMQLKRPCTHRHYKNVLQKRSSLLQHSQERREREEEFSVREGVLMDMKWNVWLDSNGKIHTISVIVSKRAHVHLHESALFFSFLFLLSVRRFTDGEFQDSFK